MLVYFTGWSWTGNEFKLQDKSNIQVGNKDKMHSF